MKISIVTPSFNQCRFLKRTMESILSQEGDFDLRLIIVDGGSTDGTVELLRSVTDPRVAWTSEKDRGQSHAINKGLAKADGDIVGWLNSDDLYAPGALRTVCETFGAEPDALWLIGRCEIIDADDRRYRGAITRYKDWYLRRYRYRRLLRENFISQPAVFWRRSFGEAVGGLDESLHYTMDYDLWARMGRRADPVFVDQTLALFRLHNESKTGQVNRAQFDEQYAVALRYLGRDHLSRIVHRFNVEKIVWAYRVMRLARL